MSGFRLSSNLQENIRNAKKAFEPGLLGPAFSFLSYELRAKVAERLLQDVSENKMNDITQYRRHFDFNYRDRLLEEIAGLNKSQIRQLCWNHCKNSCLSMSKGYSNNLKLSTNIGDLLMPEIFGSSKLKCEKADMVKEYPDYKLVFQGETLAYVDFKYRAIPYFFIDKKPFNLLCYYGIAEDIAKVKEHYGQMQRAQDRGESVHPTYHLYLIDYPCMSCVVFQHVRVLHRIMSSSGRTRTRENVWTVRESKRAEANISTYFSLLTDLRAISDLTKIINSISKPEDFESITSSLERQDIDTASRVYVGAI